MTEAEERAIKVMEEKLAGRGKRTEVQNRLTAMISSLSARLAAERIAEDKHQRILAAAARAKAEQVEDDPGTDVILVPLQR